MVKFPMTVRAEKNKIRFVIDFSESSFLWKRCHGFLVRNLDMLAVFADMACSRSLASGKNRSGISAYALTSDFVFGNRPPLLEKFFKQLLFGSARLFPLRIVVKSSAGLVAKDLPLEIPVGSFVGRFKEKAVALLAKVRRFVVSNPHIHLRMCHSHDKIVLET